MRLSPEQIEQCRIVTWMARNLPPAPEGPCWTAINPVPSKTPAVAGMSKKMGMHAGWGDILMVWKARSISVEVKTDKGRQSPEQIRFQHEFTLAGGLYCVIKSLEDFKLFVEVVGIPLRRGALA